MHVIYRCVHNLPSVCSTHYCIPSQIQLTANYHKCINCCEYNLFLLNECGLISHFLRPLFYMLIAISLWLMKLANNANVPNSKPNRTSKSQFNKTTNVIALN